MEHFIEVHRDNGDTNIINTKFITRVACWGDRKTHTRIFLNEEACTLASMDVYESLEEIKSLLLSK